MAKVKFKYSPRTEGVGGPYEDENWFRYDMDRDPDQLDWREDLPVMLDVETHSDKMRDIRLVQVFQEHWDKAVIWDTNNTPIDLIFEAIRYRHLIIHNATFELSCFQTDLGRNDCVFSNFSDTFLLARKKYATVVEGFGFDKIAEHVHECDYYAAYAKELGWTSEEVPHFKKSLQKSFLDSPKSNKRALPLTYEQLRYAGMDVVLMSKMYKELKSVEDEFIIQLDYKFIKWAQKYQLYGLPVDKTKWKHAWDNAEAKVQGATLELPEVLNVNSWVQVRKLFDSDASDDTFLATVENDFERFPDNPSLEERAKWAHNIRIKRRFIKQQAFLKSYNVPRIKGFVSPRTISGRIAAENINTLQIPRALKYIFGFEPGDDRYLVYADFSNLELRMTAAILNEETMVAKFKNKEDLHSYAGGKIYEKPVEEVSKAERFIGKFFNFSAAYGAGAARLCAMLMKEAGIYMTEDEMRPKLKIWKNTWPVIKQWHFINGRSKDNVDFTLGGRVYKANMYTDLNAIKMQGSSAEVFKLAHLYMIKSKPTIFMCNAIHDSYITETDKLIEARRDADIVAKSMIVAWFETIQNSKVPDLPMPTTALIGRNWGDIENDIYTEALEYPGTYEHYLEIKDSVLQGEL